VAPEENRLAERKRGFAMAILKVTSGSIPVGQYRATFEGVEEQPANVQKGYAAGLRWKFKVVSGPHAGLATSRVTGATPSPANACGKILSGLVGRAIKEEEEFDPDQYRGRKYLVIVEAAQGGGTRVAAVVPGE
jgi:hypothetical protein